MRKTDRINARAKRIPVEFNPNSIAGLKMWVSADSGAYNDAGVTLATNGQSVQQWNDRSGQSNNPTQAASASRPVFTTNVLNGKPIIRFDGSDDSFNFATSLSGTTQTYFMVVKTSDPDVSVILGDGVDNNTYFAAFSTSSSNIFRVSRSSGTNYADSPVGVGLGFNILSSIQDGGNTTAYLNGTVGTLQTAMGSAAITSIGGYAFATARMEGDIAEILYYDAAISNADRILIESYLNSKYAIY